MVWNVNFEDLERFSRAEYFDKLSLSRKLSQPQSATMELKLANQKALEILHQWFIRQIFALFIVQIKTARC